MVNFVLMLTEGDVTIPDAVKVYRSLTQDGESLQHVAFKDVGADQSMVKDLTDAIRADGRTVWLELADMSDRGQTEGLQLALTLGVDRVVAAWREDFLSALREPGSPEYWPFLGTLSGRPLTLKGTAEELSAAAAELSGTDGVSGVVLMPYRQQAYDPADLLHRVTSVATVPVLVAGAVSTAAQIEAIARAGAWGFTMGSALLAGRRDDPAVVARRVGEKLALCREVAARYGEPALQGGTVHATDL